MKRTAALLLLTVVLSQQVFGTTGGAKNSQTARAAGKDRAAAAAFVRVSARDRRYFETSDGRPYVPVGLNIPFLRFITDEKESLAKYEEYFKKLSEQGGNFARIWLSSPFFDVEQNKAGEYDPGRAERIDALIELAKRYGIRIKFCLEYFRWLDDTPPRFPGTVAMGRPIYHASRGGPLRDMTEYFTTEGARALFKSKLDFYAARYRDEPIIFGWELWNEIDAVRSREWEGWTRDMLAEVKTRFPRHLAMQSMGSFDAARKRESYRAVMSMPGNDVAQAHRYLDLGAELVACRGPMDVLAADAVRELQRFGAAKPILVSEVGAVEPNHAGPSKLYAADRAGVLLHDALFAPFFAGAAGPGQSWHWSDYVEPNDLWHHFGRFAKSVRGIDPTAEEFEAIRIEHPRLRVYALKGRRMLIAWCRDAQNTWQSELVERRAPETLRELTLELGRAVKLGRNSAAQIYDPWNDRRTTRKTSGGKIVLPDFSRSLVIKIEL